MPAFMPDTTRAGDREYRAQEAADDAEAARREFKELAARFAVEAFLLAKILGVEPDARQLTRAQAAGKSFHQWLTEYLSDALVENFNLPDPSEAYAEAMGE